MPHSEFWPFGQTKGNGIGNGLDESSVLHKQLGDMEGEVKELQSELAAMRKDRVDLFNIKQTRSSLTGKQDFIKDVVFEKVDEEKCNKYAEVSKLREELIRAKNAADDERFQRQKYEDKLRELENKLNSLCKLPEEQPRKLLDEDDVASKIHIRDMKEEIEELKITMNENAEQMQEYRMKYLQAQQEAEEMRRQLEAVEYDNKQVSEQVQIEIQKMKSQFQAKLQELAPLPDLLKGAQMQLQEAKELQKLAEENSHQLSVELHRVKEKLISAVNGFNQEKAERTKVAEENKTLSFEVDEKCKEVDRLGRLIDDYKHNVYRLEERLAQEEGRINEKTKECAQLHKTLEEHRIESTRALSRGKERADSMRRFLQSQVSEMERQLIQSRAQSKAFQKERDETRQRLQLQINNLQENFEMVEIRLRGLQHQVVTLKNNYCVILADNDDDLHKITS